MLEFGKPVQFVAFTGNYLEIQLGWEKAICWSKKTFPAWNQFVMVKLSTGNVKIKSRWNGSVLTVQDDGSCLFSRDQEGQSTPTQEFVLEMKGNDIFMVSCSTQRVLQCSLEGSVSCANTNRLEWEAWRVQTPESENIISIPAIKEAAYFIAESVIKIVSKYVYQ